MPPKTTTHIYKHTHILYIVLLEDDDDEEDKGDKDEEETPMNGVFVR